MGGHAQIRTQTRKISIDTKGPADINANPTDIGASPAGKSVGKVSLARTPFGDILALEPGQLPATFGGVRMKGTFFGLASNAIFTETKVEAEIGPIPDDCIAAKEQIIKCLKELGYKGPFWSW